MEDKAKRDLQRILGIQSPAISIVSASAALAGILYGAKETDNQKLYNDVTKDAQSSIRAINDDFQKVADIETAALNESLEKHTATESANIRTGMTARGITDAGQADTSVGRYKAGISGAYAAARTALLRAKTDASGKLSGAMANYYQDLAKKQYESQVQKYANQMGIWGSIGGLTGAVIDRLSLPKLPTTQSQERGIEPEQPSSIEAPQTIETSANTDMDEEKKAGI